MNPGRVEHAKRQMPIISEDKRSRIFEKMHVTRNIALEKNVLENPVLSLADAITNGDEGEIIRIICSNPLAKNELFDDKKELTKAARAILDISRETSQNEIRLLLEKGNITKDDSSAFASSIDERIKPYHSRLVLKSPESYRLFLSALRIVPDVLSNDIPSSDYSSKISWIGQADPTIKPGKIVLALSGGSAKGVFYFGFIRALRENGLYPDLLVGSSAGAMAGGMMAANKDVEPSSLFSIFNPWLIPINLVLSKGRGILARGMGKFLRNNLGVGNLSDSADFFMISTVQEPVNFGKAIIGRASSLNDNLAMSSDIPLWKAVWGSSSIQGIIPEPTVNDFKAERFSSNGSHLTNDMIELPYTSLDDGAAIEYLPIITADQILKEIKADGLIIAVNLANLNPLNAKIPAYLSLKERINGELESCPDKASWFCRTRAILRGIGGWVAQEFSKFTNEVAPMRAYKAYEAIEKQNVIQSVDLVKGRGSKILLNPNADGVLDSISLTSLKQSGPLIDYGYEFGTTVSQMLLGNYESK